MPNPTPPSTVRQDTLARQRKFKEVMRGGTPPSPEEAFAAGVQVGKAEVEPPWGALPDDASTARPGGPMDPGLSAPSVSLPKTAPEAPAKADKPTAPWTGGGGFRYELLDDGRIKVTHPNGKTVHVGEGSHFHKAILKEWEEEGDLSGKIPAKSSAPAKAKEETPYLDLDDEGPFVFPSDKPEREIRGSSVIEASAPTEKEPAPWLAKLATDLADGAARRFSRVAEGALDLATQHGSRVADELEQATLDGVDRAGNAAKSAAKGVGDYGVGLIQGAVDGAQTLGSVPNTIKDRAEQDFANLREVGSRAMSEAQRAAGTVGDVLSAGGRSAQEVGSRAMSEAQRAAGTVGDALSAGGRSAQEAAQSVGTGGRRVSAEAVDMIEAIVNRAIAAAKEGQGAVEAYAEDLKPVLERARHEAKEAVHTAGNRGISGLSAVAGLLFQDPKAKKEQQPTTPSPVGFGNAE